MGMFGRFREKVRSLCQLLKRKFCLCAEIEKCEQQRSLTQFGSALQVHEVAPGHFKPTSSERIDKMYKEVGSCRQTQVGYFDAVMAVLLSISTLQLRISIVSFC